MPKRIFTPEQTARNYANQKKWRKANADVLNLKRRNRYATDLAYRTLCQWRVKNCRAQKLRLKEAA